MLLDVHTHPPSDRRSLPAFLAAFERVGGRAITAELGPGVPHEPWPYVPDVPFWRAANERCAELVAAHSDRLRGYCYVSPEHPDDAVAELERRLLTERDIFVGLKLWVAVRCNDRRLDPLMEFCAAYDVPVLQHTFAKSAAGGPGSGNLPGESTPDDLLELARRHPRVTFFGGHVGGDWEWGIAAFRQVDNIWLDIGGGEATAGYMRLALHTVGASRIGFGSDMPLRSVQSQLAKVLSEPLSKADLERILWRNATEIFGGRLPPDWHTEPASTGLTSAGLTSAAPADEGTTVRLSATRRTPPYQPWHPAGEPTEIFDANSYLGEWPSRRLTDQPRSPRDQVDDRLRLMDRLGIARAAVSRLEGVWLKDPSVANTELARMLEPATDRFHPVYTLNPAFPAWRLHLRQCREELGLGHGVGAVRLHPQFHGYSLDDPRLDECLGELAQMSATVVLPIQVEDSRMHHSAMRAPDLDPAAVANLAARWPHLRLILAAAPFDQITAVLNGLGEAPSVWVDLSRVHGPLDVIPTLLPAAGEHRLMYGSNLPLHVPETLLLELADAGLPRATLERILYHNAKAALG